MGFDMRKQTLAVPGECEEVVVLLQPLWIQRRMVGASTANQFLGGIEVIAVRTVPTGIGGLINVAALLRSAEHFLRGACMACLGGANPVIV